MSLPLHFLRPATLRVIKPSRQFTVRVLSKQNSAAPSSIASFHQCHKKLQPSSSDPPPATGPNQDVLGHVSEEAAKTAEIMGETPVEVEEHGTPISEVMKRDGGKDNAPQVMQEEIENDVSTTPSLSELASDAHSPSVHASLSHSSAITLSPSARHIQKFPDQPVVDIPPFLPPIPDTPIPANHHLQHRYNPLLAQLIPLFQKDGKKAKAQSTVQEVLRILRTKPPPIPSTKHLLVPTTPPPQTLPANPIAYLQTAIDSVAPLLKLRSSSGKGGSTLQTPFPLPVRQRRRKAVEWIMAASERKKKMMGLAERFAAEIVDVVEGRSPAWEKRMGVHKLGIVNRANMSAKPMKKKKLGGK